MAEVKVHLSMSLDGFVAGTDVSVGQAMGVGGERLHGWLFADPMDPVDAEVASEMFAPASVGAVIMGRRTFDVGIGHWGDDGTFGIPCFVATTRPAETVSRGATTFTFVEDVEQALSRARAVAGSSEIKVMGAAVARQVLEAGAADEVEVDLVPVLLGAGAPLFAGLAAGGLAFEQVEVRAGAAVTHLRYRVQRPHAS